MQFYKRRPRRSLLAGGAAGGLLGSLAGGLAIASRLGAGTRALNRSLEAEPRVYQWRGWRVVYYQHGEGVPLVLLHSINAAASAYEMRAPFARHKDSYQVYALDLLGFGASDRPPIEYSAGLYADLLSDFLRDVVQEPAHVVASSLSAAHVVAAAHYHPQLFRSLLLINPTGLRTLVRPQGAWGRLVEALYRTPLIGEGLFKLLVSRPGLRYFLRKVYSDPNFIEDRLVEQNYLAAHQPGARYAAAAFIGGALNQDIRELLPATRPRTLVLWSCYSGYQDIGEEQRLLSELAPSLASETFSDTGALPHDEQRERFERLLCDWLDLDRQDQPAREQQAGV